MIANEFDHFIIDFCRINQDEYGITICYWNFYQISRVWYITRVIGRLVKTKKNMEFSVDDLRTVFYIPSVSPYIGVNCIRPTEIDLELHVYI